MAMNKLKEMNPFKKVNAALEKANNKIKPIQKQSPKKK